jgi:hypothetical protein
MTIQRPFKTMMISAETGQVEPNPFLAVWTYDPDEPHQISVSFKVGAHNSIDWAFGRDLLAKGLVTPAGEGDVRLDPNHPSGLVVITLSSPAGIALVGFDPGELAAFEADLRRAVPKPRQKITSEQIRQLSS